MLILDVTIDGSEYILANISNTNKERLKDLNDLSELMKKVNITHGKQIVLAGDLNLFFDSNLEARGDKPVLKEKSVARMVELNENYDLCDIWRIRNSLEKSFTFQQEAERLEAIFLSQTSFKNFFNKAVILPAFKNDHLSLSVIISNYHKIKPGQGL